MRAHALRSAALCACIIAMMPMRRAAADEERKAFVWLPGPAREIPTTTSASRDAPVSAMAYGPRVRGDLAGEFGLFALLGDALEFRFGMRGMIEIEHQDAGLRGPPVPGLGKGPMLWRGLYGGSFAFSLPRLGRALGAHGGFELTAFVGHESDHATDISHPTLPPGAIDDGGGGNFVGGDVAVRFPLATALELSLRAQDRHYLVGVIANAPGLDVVLRFRALPEVQPLLGVFGERLFVHHDRNDAKNGHLITALVGVAFPGRAGEVTPFVSLEEGNAKGLLIDRTELRFAAGVRYAPF